MNGYQQRILCQKLCGLVKIGLNTRVYCGTLDDPHGQAHIGHIPFLCITAIFANDRHHLMDIDILRLGYEIGCVIGLDIHSRGHGN